VLELTQRLLEAAQGGEPVVVASVLEPGPTDLVPGSRLLIERDGRRIGTLGSAALDDLLANHAEGMFARHAAETLYVTETGLSDRTVVGATSIYAEVLESKPVFVVVGAGHIGRSLVKLADFLDFHVVAIDDRDDFADPERLPEADQVLCGEYEEALDGLAINANTSIVMVTRGHKQDELALRHALGRGAGYIGMIGSKRRTSAVLAHLKADGFDPEELERVRTPIGLDIGAETPEEIAISIMAEVVLLRRGGSAAPMYWRRGRSEGVGS
jgi:xanthine dehydrogenase accessory factor